MDWPESVNMEKGWYQCKFCGGRLSDTMRRTGRWVSRYTNREFSGYWVNLMMCPWVPAKELIDKWNSPDVTKEFFFNMILGKPYESKDGSISRVDILRNLSNEVIPQEGVVIGCDVGLIKHYVIGTANGIFHHGKAESWDDIRALMRLYPKALLIVDSAPDLTGPRQIREEFKGRVFLAHYIEDKKTLQLVHWGKGDEEGTVKIDRNRMIQHIVEEFKGMRIPLQGMPEDWEPYIKHWMNLYRVSDVDRLGQQTYRWDKKTTEDHWAHATVYWRAGVTEASDSAKIISGNQQMRVNAIELIPGLSGTNKKIIESTQSL
jgi:hypothetical protein